MEDAAPRTAARRIDPDAAAAPRREPFFRGQALPCAVIAVGGAIGACCRFALGLAWPTPPGHFPAATLTVNVIGCALMGAFMVLVTSRWQAHRLLRPFFGTGVLGGFTTFSTYEVDLQGLLRSGHAGMALIYLLGTVLAALIAVWAGAAITRAIALRGWQEDAR